MKNRFRSFFLFLAKMSIKRHLLAHPCDYVRLENEGNAHKMRIKLRPETSSYTQRYFALTLYIHLL